MSKKKMCSHWMGKNMLTMVESGKCWDGHYKGCPKNTNAKCEIIPKKPKMVRVKAWALRIAGEEMGVTASNSWLGFGDRQPPHSFPCTILIDEKYLRRKP